MTLTVGQLAELSGVTVRTLHHYDSVGLLAPKARSSAGYRLYEHEDCERLQEILFYRELGFELGEIRSLLGDSAYDRSGALHQQRDLLVTRTKHLQAMIGAIDTALDAQEKGLAMTKEEMFDVFGDFDPKLHEAEVEQRWAGAAVDESRRRTRRYGKDQWREAIEEGESIVTAFAEQLEAGATPAGAPAMDLAEEHRQHIGRWFYECSPAMQAGLGELYASDPRFMGYYEKYAPGLANFVKAAIDANRARSET